MNLPIEILAPEALCARLASGETPLILDVRTGIEHAACHLACPHAHIPLDRLDIDDWLRDHPGAAGERVHILCASGRRAASAAALFAARGIAVSVVDGGLSACLARNIPARGRKVISLERQVRMAAGALVLAGALAGWGLHPAFFLLCGLVGAGLFVAGLTGFCGMALLLARAPWNRDRAAAAARESLQRFERNNQGA